MSSGATQKKWLKAVIKQLNAMEGVETEVLQYGHYKLTIHFNGASRFVTMGVSPGNSWIAQKKQYKNLCKEMTALGIKEQLKYVAAKVSTAAGAKRQEELRAWQTVWQTIRKAEKSLDRELRLFRVQ
jgi:hypothetical protein